MIDPDDFRDDDDDLLGLIGVVLVGFAAFLIVITFWAMIADAVHRVLW